MFNSRIGQTRIQGAVPSHSAYSLRRHPIRRRIQIDLLVEDSVIVELKVVEHVLPVHEAQLLSYLRMSDLKLGLLINFNQRLLRDGIRRAVNNF